jgi:hypothetical protein
MSRHDSREASRENGLVADLCSALGISHEYSEYVGDPRELPPTLERYVRALSRDREWLAWRDEGRLRLVVATTIIARGDAGGRTKVEAQFFDHDRLAATGTWERVALGSWTLTRAGPPEKGGRHRESAADMSSGDAGGRNRRTWAMPPNRSLRR